MKTTKNRVIKRNASLAARHKAKEIKSLLDSCSDEMPTVSLLESKYHLSRIYLQQGFRELYGMTIGFYIKKRKLQMIKDLLKEYSLTLDSIAIRTGYNGSEALCRFFKMTEGISPGQWRKNYLRSETAK